MLESNSLRNSQPETHQNDEMRPERSKIAPVQLDQDLTSD